MKLPPDDDLRSDDLVAQTVLYSRIRGSLGDAQRQRHRLDRGHLAPEQPDPRGLTFQIEAADYARPVELLEAYRREQPRAQMSDLMRHIIATASERPPVKASA
jgi:hypothetical protein